MKKNIIALILVLSISLISVPNTAFGDMMFTDVNEGYWAEKYIDTMVNVGIMSGYDDGTFRPNDKVNKVQAVVMISKLLYVGQSEITSAREKYEEFLKNYNLTEDEKNNMSVIMDKGIVSKDIVEKEFFSNGAPKTASKLEVCLYLVRAMGIEGQTSGRIFKLSYKDAETIPVNARPYIDLLIEKGIIDKEGDAGGKFNPNQEITRGVLAKMLYLAYNEMNNGNINVTPGNNSKIQNDDSGISGTVVENTGEFLIIDTGNKKDSYEFTSNTLIMLDGKTGTKDDIKRGMVVKITASAGNKLDSVKNESTDESLSGTIKSIDLGASPSMVVEYKDDSGNTKSQTFYLSNDTKVSLDGKEGFLYSLEEGDLVDIHVLNNLVVSISAETKSGTVKGILKDEKFEDGFQITVERDDESLLEYTVEDNATIKRNSVSANISELRRGDELNISLTYGKVTGIDAKSVKGENEGTISEILIKEEPQITIVNSEGEKITYYVSKDVSVNIEDKLSEIYDLRLGYHAKLVLESDEIISVDVDEKTLNNEYMGEVEYINADAGFLRIKINGSQESLNVNLSSNISIKDMDGKSVSINDITGGDKVLVKGYMDKGYFVADKIVLAK